MTIEDVWYGDSGRARAARRCLRPLSALYGSVVALRGALYDRGVLRSGRAPAPVVSVGALSAGGSGKTPFVLWLAQRLAAEGLRPCIVTRGYGRGGQGFYLLSSRERAGSGETVERVGDEATMLALRSGCPVAVAAGRLQACHAAALELSRRGEPLDLFLLDDGFQHRAIARDLDIVMLGDADPGALLLPGGPLREGTRALGRADVVVSTGSGAVADSLRGTTMHLRARFRPSLLVWEVADAFGEHPSALAGRRVVAVAAIARPERFLADLRAAGAEVVATLLRRDHHRYDAADRRAIEEAARGAELVVTTDKDLVKLAGGDFGGRLRALRIETQVEGGDALVARVRRIHDEWLASAASQLA